MNTTPHVLVADAVRVQLGWGDATRAHIAAGAVAPDAYRVVPGLGFRALHFRGGRRRGGVLRQFADDYVVPAFVRGRSDEQAFWTGWYCHLLCDQVWRRTLKAELPDLWAGVTHSRGDDRQHLRDQYQAACDLVDVQLAAIPGSQVAELRWLLRAWTPQYEVGLVGVSHLREWVVQVTSNAMPPDEPVLAGPEGLDFALVQRAMSAAQELVCGEMVLLMRRAEEAPQFDDMFDEV